MLETLFKWGISVSHHPETHKVVEQVVAKTPYVASTMAVIPAVSGITLNETALLVGIACAIVTAVFNIWFKMKYKRNRKREL